MMKRPAFCPSNIRKAFTLTELLVVIAILAVLAALLLPVLSRTQQTTERIQCVSQLRQLGLAAEMYWTDHDGMTFRYRGVNTNGGTVYWFGWLEHGREGEREFDPAYGKLYPYLQGKGVEICPAFNRAFHDYKRKAKGASYGYGYNLSLSASLSRPPVPISRVKVPSRTAVLGDSAQINDFQPPASPEHPMLEEFYYLNTNEATVHFRHPDRTANILFCDGHVDTEKPVTGSLDERMPGQTVGRVRAEILRLR